MALQYLCDGAKTLMKGEGTKHKELTIATFVVMVAFNVSSDMTRHVCSECFREIVYYYSTGGFPTNNEVVSFSRIVP
jgi:hypothetical protein